MGGGVYLITESQGLVEMIESSYESEDFLQGLLADYPNLLAGDQISSEAPRRWLLVSREVSLASEEDGAGRWSVDHLFLDQDAIPTIVEVKRGTDTRIRREVVGQMLDYAANAVVYWPVETLRERFESSGEEYERRLTELLEQSDAEPDEFWQSVKTNLQAGRVRLIFVADEIPAELRRVVEFLNHQMDPAEVLAVEIKQYVGQGMKTLVPRVIGQTVEKPVYGGGGKRWDYARFFQELENRVPEALGPARAIFEWATENTTHVTWGKGKLYGTFSPTLVHKDREYKPVQVWTEGTVYVQFGDLQNSPAFNEESARAEFLGRLNEIPGVALPEEAIGKYPVIKLSILSENSLRQFLETLDWVTRQIRLS